MTAAYTQISPFCVPKPMVAQPSTSAPNGSGTAEAVCDTHRQVSPQVVSPACVPGYQINDSCTVLPRRMPRSARLLSIIDIEQTAEHIGG
jgi:hypothetical protein